MSDKSAQKRKYIIEKARTVFESKGFLNVTMKDIVDACEISRGGLYLYFSDTRTIFLEVLSLSFEESKQAFENAISDEATPAEVLAIFLREQKKELLAKKKGLNRAMYEFCFLEKNAKDNPLKRWYDENLYLIEKLIEAGVETEEFYSEDPRRAASNILYILEGLKIASLTRKLGEAAIDREIMYVMQSLVIE